MLDVKVPAAVHHSDDQAVAAGDPAAGKDTNASSHDSTTAAPKANGLHSAPHASAAEMSNQQSNSQGSAKSNEPSDSTKTDVDSPCQQAAACSVSYAGTHQRLVVQSATHQHGCDVAAVANADIATTAFFQYYPDLDAGMKICCYRPGIDATASKADMPDDSVVCSADVAVQQLVENVGGTWEGWVPGSKDNIQVLLRMSVVAASGTAALLQGVMHHSDIAPSGCDAPSARGSSAKQPAVAARGSRFAEAAGKARGSFDAGSSNRPATAKPRSQVSELLKWQADCSGRQPSLRSHAISRTISDSDQSAYSMFSDTLEPSASLMGGQGSSKRKMDVATAGQSILASQWWHQWAKWWVAEQQANSQHDKQHEE